MAEKKRKKEYMTDDKGRKLMRYEGDTMWQLRKDGE